LPMLISDLKDGVVYAHPSWGTLREAYRCSPFAAYDL